MGLFSFIKERFNQSELNRLEDQTNEVLALEEEMASLEDDALRVKTKELRERAQEESLDDLLPEAFALIREAAWRVIGLKAYPVQIMGGIVLHQGRVAEMKTGEGKTLVAIMPLFLNALEGKGAHLVTVNDYLASFQSRWMGEVFEFLGMSVGCITNGLSAQERKREYNKDITYGTNNEFGFDFLRDNMEIYEENKRQRGFHFAIVDEVDSILIDEARTPLIISGRGQKSSQMYEIANRFVMGVHRDDVTIDEKEKSIFLTDETGIPKAERFFNIDNLSDPENMEISHHVNQAIRAKFLMKKDNDYVVQNNQVIIVDEFTGRLMPGRRYSNGLHQAIEAKENIAIKDESQTLATITLQNYFRMYDKLSGMTGTAKTEEDEFKEIYNMDVVVIPTNRPVIREDLNDVIYGRQAYKDQAIVEEIVERYKKKQPMLVGTISVEYSEYLSSLLKKRGIPHNVLNAKEHQRESEIVAQAGRLGAVTIATNMAGRGTDILLGGNVEFILREKLRKEGFDEDVITKALSPFEYDLEDVKACAEKVKAIRPAIEEEVAKEADLVKAAGGLHVLGTSRHEARRIDNQLRGRSGRQGDPGSSQFFLALDDDLLRIFMSESVTELMNKIGMGEGVPIENKIISRNIEKAQQKVESINYGSRKSVLKYDEVMNQQRRFIYQERDRVLHGENLKEHVMGMLEENIDSTVDQYTQEVYDLAGLKNDLANFYGYREPLLLIEEGKNPSQLKEELFSSYTEIYDKRESIATSERFREIERVVLLTSVDENWIMHMDDMDNLRQGIGLRAIGQQDPMVAYQIEGFDLYEDMLERIKEDTLRKLFRVDVQAEQKRVEMAEETSTSSSSQGKPKTYEKKEEVVGRNDPCPCGSGKKYKHCHMLKES